MVFPRRLGVPVRSAATNEPSSEGTYGERESARERIALRRDFWLRIVVVQFAIVQFIHERERVVVSTSDGAYANASLRPIRPST